MKALRVALSVLFLIAAAVACVASHGETGERKKSKAGGPCGGIAGYMCEEGLWCELEAGVCFGADVMGTCLSVPEICTKDYNPVCGCDGRTYGNDCERRQAMVSKKRDGACPAK